MMLKATDATQAGFQSFDAPEPKDLGPVKTDGSFNHENVSFAPRRGDNPWVVSHVSVTRAYGLRQVSFEVTNGYCFPGERGRQTTWRFDACGARGGGPEFHGRHYDFTKATGDREARECLRDFLAEWSVSELCMTPGLYEFLTGANASTATLVRKSR